MVVLQAPISAIKVNVKVRTHDIAPLRESSPQKRSGMDVFSRDLTLLPAHSHVHPQSERLPHNIAGTHLPIPE